VIDCFLAVESAIKNGESFTLVVTWALDMLLIAIDVVLDMDFGGCNACNGVTVGENSGWDSGNLDGGLDRFLGSEVFSSALL